MKNEDKSNDSLKAKSDRSGHKSGLLTLAGIGILIGVLLAILFVSQDRGADAGTTQPQLRTKEGKVKKIEPVSANKAAITLSTAKQSGVDEMEIIYEDPIEEVKQAFGDREDLNVLPPPKLHPRIESEWQGMLVDTSMQAICQGENSCGLAMACIDNRCGPCSADADCGTGEVCVLDHCVVEKNTSCRSASDCGANEYCILSGYSDDARGNQNTLSFCQASISGTQPDPEAAVDPIADNPGPQVFERPVSMDQLHETLLEFDNNMDATPDVDRDRQITAEPFDEATAEFEFEHHETLDKTDPENEHVVVEDENEVTDSEPVVEP